MQIYTKNMAAGLLTSVVGLITLIGWLFDIEPLKRIHAGSPVMHPDTALAFVLSGLSLIGMHAGYPRMVRASAYIVLTLGVLPILTDVTGSRLYMSLWQFARNHEGNADFAGHMSAMSSSVIILSGLGLFSLGKGKDAFPPAQLAALGILVIAAFALIGYAYDVPSFYTPRSVWVMSMHSAFAAATLGIGLLLAEHARGFAAIIFSELSGGIMLRLMLPYVIAVPAILGWLRLQGEYAGLYGTNAGLALFALSNITLLVIFSYRSARLMNRKDIVLQKIEGRANEIIDHTLDAIITANDQGIIESFNASASRMFGYAPYDVIGKNVSLLMPEPYRSEHDDHIENYLRTGTERILRQGRRREFPAQRPDGSVFSIEVAVSEVFSEGKRYFIALMHDITQRKLMMEQLRASEDRYRSLINNIPDTVWSADATGKRLFISSNVERILGFGMDELLAANPEEIWFSRMHPEDVNHVREAWSGLFTQRHMFDVEYRYRRKDGTWVWLHERSLDIYEKDGVLCADGLFSDVSERVQSRLALKASEKRLRTIFDAEPECIKIVNMDGSLLDINPAGLAMIEADAAGQVIGQDCGAFIAPRYNEAFHAFLASATQGDTAHLQFEITGLKGSHRWLDAVAVALPLEELRSPTLLIVARDTTTQQLAEQALRANEARYRRIFESNMLGIGYWKVDGGITDANDKLLEIIGYTREEMLAGNLNWIAITPPKYTHADQNALKAILETGACTPFEKEYIHKDGHRIQVLIGGAAFEDSKVSGVFFVLDISARILAETQLRKLSLAVEHSPTAIVITDINSTIEYVNPKFYQLTGYTPEEVLGCTPRILQSGLTPPETYKTLWKTILSGEEWHGEFHDRKKDGQIYWCLQSISPVKNECGEITHFVSVTEDISDRKHSESLIRHLAFYDPLTDLPNRTLFRDRLEQTAAHAQRDERMFAVMYLDLDRFKNVNDTLGHPVGDLLLKAAAERMRKGLRETDTIARLGGDEFAIIVQDMDCHQDALRLAEHLLQSFSAPFFIEEHELFITPSIGVSIYPQDSTDIDALIKVADIALYRAKELGRNNCQFFTADMNAEAMEHMLMENQLQHVLERKELILHYQPQINLASGTICGVEALLRWRHPTHGMVSPGTFIPIAEDSGLIVPIGEWVLRESCLANKAWMDAGLPEMLVAVNVSAKQLRQRNFVNRVSIILEETGLPHHLLEIELTESCVMHNPEQVISILEELKAMGVKLAMDDFGTGYSSLAYLKRLPFDKVKIDRSFVIDMVTDANDAAIARTIISMTHSMHRIAIAEGVETEAQLNFLSSEGCDEIQGYYFSSPLEDAALVRFIQEHNWRVPRLD